MTVPGVTSEHGTVQKVGDGLWVMYKGFMLILDHEELDELIALLQAYQQEMNPNCPHCQEGLARHTEAALKAATGRRIRRESGENIRKQAKTGLFDPEKGTMFAKNP